MARRKSERKSELPTAPLPDLVRWWRKRRTRGVIIGGLAVGLLGRPRVTRDVDALILLEEEAWTEFVKSGKDYAFEPRIPDVVEFAHESRVLLLHHRESGIEIDISLGSIPFEEETVARAVKTRVAGVLAPLPTPEDLIIMKLIAHREQDLRDIEGLLDAHPVLDTGRILRIAKEFAEVLETATIVSDIETLLKSRRGRPRR